MLVELCRTVLHFDAAFIISHVLPGTLLTVGLGNLYFAHLARQRSGCAMPYGLSTVFLYANIFWVMLPAKIALEADAPAESLQSLIWGIGMATTFSLGLLVSLGAQIALLIQRGLPRTALLAPIGGIGLFFLSTHFLRAAVAAGPKGAIPLIVMLVAFAFKKAHLGRIQVIVIAILIGIVVQHFQSEKASSAVFSPQWSPPTFAFDSLQMGLTTPHFRAVFLSVVLPLSISNLLGSLQNLEAAKASKDEYPALKAVRASGIANMLGALFGGGFTGTIYVGHEGLKELGAQWRYSRCHGVAILVISFLGISLGVSHIVPVEAGFGILVWIGLFAAAQSFRETAAQNFPVLLLGLIPAAAAWGSSLLSSQPNISGNEIGKSFETMASLGHGFLVSSMLWVAIVIYLRKNQFFSASLALFVLALLCVLGVLHTPQAQGITVMNFNWALAYLALGFSAFGIWLYRVYQREYGSKNE